jgi:hypothetical protein
LGLYVDGRYGSVKQQRPAPAALADFIAGAVTHDRALAVDPDRRLPDPSSTRARSTVRSRDRDPSQESLTPRRFAGSSPPPSRPRTVPCRRLAIVSVSNSFHDGWSERDLVTRTASKARSARTSFSAWGQPSAIR